MGWEELTVPYFCQPAACPFWICALFWGHTVHPTDGPGLNQPDCDWKTALVAKLEG